MTQDWDEHGARVPLTVLWIDDCQVVGIKWKELHNYYAMQVGAGHRLQQNVDPCQAGFYLQQNLNFKDVMTEFKVSKDALLPVGTQITAAHFVSGQHMDVTGWSKWKGFQGVMKKHHFKGLPASHGVSLAHRSPGAIGNRTDPGKIWKGKKMPGNMGDERRTVHNMLVYRVDAARNLIYVRGQVPGLAGRPVYLRDAFNTLHPMRLAWGLPHPTFCGQGGAALSDVGRAGMALLLADGRAQVKKHGRPTTPVRGSASPDEPGKKGVKGTRVALPELAVVTTHLGAKDPYIPYAKETDYFEVRWKKSD